MTLLPRLLCLSGAPAIALCLCSCYDNLEQKRAKIAEWEKKTADLQEDTRIKDEFIAGVVMVDDLDEKLLSLTQQNEILKRKADELDSFIDALTIRRDGLKARLDDFRITHPIE